jgi:hypothetical protein
MENKMAPIHVTNFVRRQTPDSQFTHWTVSDNELVDRVLRNLDKAQAGYREGVILVPVEPEGFFSKVVSLKKGDEFFGEYVSRRNGEEPRKSSFLKGQATPAETVWVVLYAHHVLREKNENESNADYEIVSVNGSPSKDTEPPPMPPETLIANHFEMSGGTATKMSDSEFVKSLRESVNYWKDKINVKP